MEVSGAVEHLCKSEKCQGLIYANNVILAFFAWDMKVSSSIVLLLQETHDFWSVYPMAAEANTYNKSN